MNRKQIERMVNLQNDMNLVIDNNWVNRGWDFLRAAALEGAEAVEHHGWKWWKAQNKNIEQLQMELVDIWHFILSHYIQKNKGDLDFTINEICVDLEFGTRFITFDSKEYDLNNLTTLSKFDLLIGLFSSKRIELGVFFSICNDLGLTHEELYRQYIQKNVLNIFRQNNGYKEGTYVKIWNGREDNEHLVEISVLLSESTRDYFDSLYEELTKRYPEAK